MNDKAEIAWLKQLTQWAFLTRAVLVLVLHWSGLSARLGPDEQTYAETGRDIALYWTHDLLVRPWRLSSPGPLSYFYLNGVSFLLFGSSLPLKVLNALIGALTCRYAYLLADALFGPSVAKRTARFVAFFPSLVLWAAINVRDIWVIFLIVYISWKSYQLLATFTLTDLVRLVAAIALVNTFRPYLFFVVALPPVAALLIGQRGHLARNLAAAMLAGVATVMLIEAGVAARSSQMLDLETLADKRRDLTFGAASSFEQDADISTPAKALAFLPTGLAYFWFSPFPWQITSLLKILSLPEVLLVYALTPSVVRGLAWILRHRLREAAQVLLLTALLTVSYALASGNVGTMFRHRAQAMIFYLMFASVGIEERQRRRARA
jgi:hypothetical protein